MYSKCLLEQFSGIKYLNIYEEVIPEGRIRK